MEGIGSRLGRASSRYGTATTVFNGPVRKWKKKWVLASSSSAITYHSSSSSSSQSQSQSQSQSNSQKLLLCRWTPLPPTTSNDADAGPEPPRRKFRYTPIAVLEELKKAESKNIKDEVGMQEIDQSVAKTETVGNEIQGGLNVNEIFEEETEETDNILNSPQDVKGNHLDLALCLNGQNENRDSVG